MSGSFRFAEKLQNGAGSNIEQCYDEDTAPVRNKYQKENSQYHDHPGGPAFPKIQFLERAVPDLTHHQVG